MALDTLGYLLARHITPASAADRGEVEALARTAQAVTADNVEITWVDQGYTGEPAAQAASHHRIALEVLKLPEAKRGFVLLPRRWVVERSFAWATKFLKTRPRLRTIFPNSRWTTHRLLRLPYDQTGR